MRGNTSTQLMTVKVPLALLNLVDQRARQLGVSKGEVLRQALRLFLDQSGGTRELVRGITEDLWRQKKGRSTVDWQVIFRKTRQAMAQSPEDEVLHSRRRGL